MTIGLNDAFWAVVVAGKEVVHAATGANRAERAASTAAVMAAAYATGAAGVGTAQAAQLALAASEAALDELDVPPDSPFRRATATTVNLAATVATGGATTGTLIEAALEVATSVAAGGMEAAGLEGAAHLASLGGFVSVQGGAIDATETAFRVGGATIGGATAAGVHAAADPSARPEDRWRAVGIGLEQGQALGSASRAGVDGRTDACAASLADVAIRAGLTAVATARAEAQGDADVLAAARAAGGARFVEGAISATHGEPSAAITEAHAAARSVVGLIEETELAAKARFHERRGRKAVSFRRAMADVGRAQAALGAVSREAARLLEPRREDADPVDRTER